MAKVNIFPIGPRCLHHLGFMAWRDFWKMFCVSEWPWHWLGSMQSHFDDQAFGVSSFLWFLSDKGSQYSSWIFNEYGTNGIEGKRVWVLWYKLIAGSQECAVGDVLLSFSHICTLPVMYSNLRCMKNQPQMLLKKSCAVSLWLDVSTFQHQMFRRFVFNQCSTSSTTQDFRDICVYLFVHSFYL